MIHIEPIKKVRGSITVPGDKSISHRALMLLSIGNGTGRIRGLLKSADVLATMKAFQAMGIEIVEESKEIVVQGKGLYGLTEPTEVLNLENSGTTLRLLSGILVGQPFLSVLTGDESLRNRPMGRIIEPLQAMGAKIYGRDQNRKAPLVILKSPLKGGMYHGKIASAQVKSAVLLASLYHRESFTYIEPRESRDHTERMMAYLGIPMAIEGGKIHMLSPKESSEFSNKDIEVPGDLSSAAFFLALAAARPGFEMTIRKVGINPSRSGMLKVLKAMGGSLEILNQQDFSGEPVGDIRIHGKKLRNINIPREMIPSLIDELPIIAVLASQAEGDMEISGAEELKVKESDRIRGIVQEMGKLGVMMEEKPDGMKIYGDQKILGGTVHSHGDHRIAMSMVIAGLLSEQGVSLEDEGCIAVSFPDFLEKVAYLRGENNKG